MKLPYIDSIWCVRGVLDFVPAQSTAQVFERLDDLFQQAGTSRELAGDTLSFRKKDPLAQDKMASFHNGTLTVAQVEGTTRLSYELVSKTLLFCFCLPPFFAIVALLVEGAGTSGWVFAGIFAALYIVGRILEPWLIRREFRNRVEGTVQAELGAPAH